MSSPLENYSPKLVETIPSSVPILTETVSYFVKLYVYNREPLFGSGDKAAYALNESGHIAADEWVRSAKAYPNVTIDQWRVLPDRLESIVNISESAAATQYGIGYSKPRLLSSFIASYKAVAAKRINLVRNSLGSPLWQRSYEERFIPDEMVLKRVQQLLKS